MAVIFIATTFGVAEAGTFQIPAKGKKKIKIGVMDLYAPIESSALVCKWYRKWAKDRGWELQVFDVNLDYAKAQTIMDNMITAGYDGIIINWTDFKYYPQQIQKAYKKGIPVQGIACGGMVPGVISHGTAADMPMGSLSALSLRSKVREGGEIIAYFNPRVENETKRWKAAKLTLETYGIKVHQELNYPGSGDAAQVGYDMIKNALLADTNKVIKGIWTASEVFGVPAARVALDMKRNDITVVTSDGNPNTLEVLRTNPRLYAISDAQYAVKNWTEQLFKNFDTIFAGKPFEDEAVWFATPILITKDNVPPPGYWPNPCGYKGRAPDFKVK
jgi:ABC-type sugar transport system substrate-binding protein